MFDGKNYDSNEIVEVGLYEGLHVELPAKTGIKMTRKAWASGIPGSCTNCALAIAGREKGNPLAGEYFSEAVTLRGIWVGRSIAHLLLQDGTGTEAVFKAYVPVATARITSANDITEWENRGECPNETYWFNKMDPGTINHKREYNLNYNKEARPEVDFLRIDKAHKNPDKPTDDSITFRPRHDNPLRDGRGKIHLRKISG